MSRDADRPGEFDIISRFFAPLSKGEFGALGLRDDAALLAPKRGNEFVLTVDAIVESVHFLKSDPPHAIAQKALRVNLSDLAAKGARPRAYMLTTAWPPWVDGTWIEAFSRGLAHDQELFHLTLIGGDTVSTPGPLTVSITAIGEVVQGGMFKRAGARAGDDIWVTGSIGDAGLGLLGAKGDLGDTPDSAKQYLLGRYLVPEPRVSTGLALAGLVHSSIDVSDGLVADLEHMSVASGVGFEIQSGQVPHSPDARRALSVLGEGPGFLLTAGDDYEIAFAAGQSARPLLADIARRTGVSLTRIGKVVEKSAGVTIVAPDGGLLQFARKGFTHS